MALWAFGFPGQKRVMGKLGLADTKEDRDLGSVLVGKKGFQQG